MRLAATCCTTLLILLLFAVPGHAEDDGPLAEIILDCSLAMKAVDPELDSRMEMAWQALAAHYQRIAEDPNGLLRTRAAQLLTCLRAKLRQGSLCGIRRLIAEPT